MLLYEQKVHVAQQKFRGGEAWLKYDEGFRAKMQTWPIIDWDHQNVVGFVECMVTAREGLETQAVLSFLQG